MNFVVDFHDHCVEEVVSKCPNESRNRTKITGLIAIVLFLWIVIPGAIWHFLPDLTDRGQFGDMFGAVNALFAGLAFGGIIIALYLQQIELRHQREELKLQRKELKLTRQEITGQKEQLKAQDNTLKRQNFENSFFQLLSFHIKIVDSLETVSSSRTLIGRRCFRAFVNDLEIAFEDKPGRDINHIWQKFADRNQQRVDLYFRHLYNAINFVDQHPFLQDFEERKYYTNLIRGHLSSNEQGVLFYNCLSDGGHEFKCLVEKYSLLEGMDNEVLLDPAHKGEYAEIAYDTPTFEKK